MANLIEITDQGLFCAAGNFHIDPWQEVDRAVITHAHADHARAGSRHFLTARPGAEILRLRLGAETTIQKVEYGEKLTLNDVHVSLHPAGHILGSAQIRVEHRGEVWVVSGDYKTESDPTCAPFELVPCHAFITESTFGLPIFQWSPAAGVLADIEGWWRVNQQAGRASVLFCYALGKAQRLLAGLDASIGPLCTHGAVEKMNAGYRAAGVYLPDTRAVAAMPAQGPWNQSLIVAPPSAQGTPWMRRFGDASAGYLSGWMQIRGMRRRKAVDRGFVFSDHADWQGLCSTIRASGAQKVWVTHGYTEVLARWLREQGVDAATVRTPYEGESDTADNVPGEEATT